MLHEILLSLLGFTGDIIIDKDDTFQVADCIDLLTIAERDQINRIVPCGWFYIKLGDFVSQYELQWNGQGSSSYDCCPQAYRTALCMGVSDLLAEYADDIAYLEQLILSEGPVPLSHVLQHVQKYLLVMPVIYKICKIIQTRDLRGCQVLDFLANFQCGLPIVNAVVERMLLHVRVVFLKQILAWMVYGDLDDKGSEFFIQFRSRVQGETKSNSSVDDSRKGSSHSGQSVYRDMLHKLGRASATKNSSSATKSSLEAMSFTSENVSSDISFDWTMSFTLRLNFIPESHITPRLAHKVLFTGKAVKLLRSPVIDKMFSQEDLSAAMYKDVYSYISGGGQYDGNQQFDQSNIEIPLRDLKKNVVDSSVNCNVKNINSNTDSTNNLNNHSSEKKY